MASVDFSCRDENKTERCIAVGVGELKRTVIVSESFTVRVGDGDELEECEVNGGVGDGEGGELDGVDGDLGSLWFEDEKVDDE